ncbi:MAG: hypothetical protein IIC69_03280 [Nanoarchaeota archaeon]|nr:hypothetical protein [Nanoarchaeota archaeon]
MTQVTFIGMSTSDIDRVMPLGTKVDFLDVKASAVNNLEGLAKKLDPKAANIVVRHANVPAEGVTQAVDRITGVRSSHINTIIPYDPSSGIDYSRMLYDKLKSQS